MLTSLSERSWLLHVWKRRCTFDMQFYVSTDTIMVGCWETLSPWYFRGHSSICISEGFYVYHPMLFLLVGLPLSGVKSCLCFVLFVCGYLFNKSGTYLT